MRVVDCARRSFARPAIAVAVIAMAQAIGCASSDDSTSTANGAARDGGSSGGAATGAGGSVAAGASSGSGAGQSAGGAAACPPECFVENLCVATCGDTPRSYGCCPCPSGMINARSCRPAEAGTGADAASLASCDPRRVLCRAAPPSCPQGQVPSIDGSCWGACVPIESCGCTVADDCPDPSQYTCHLSARACGPFI